MTLASNMLLQLVKKVFRCCENLSYNWFQKLLGYSGDELNCTSNLVCGLPSLTGTSLANLVPIGLGITELHRCENCIFFLPVNILTVWHAGFLGRTTHYRVS